MRDDDYTPEERQRFEELPRESAPDPIDEERIAARLRAEGFFEKDHAKEEYVASAFRRKTLPLLAMTAAAMLIAGVLIGTALSNARSLESELARKNLTAPEAAALLERARGAYATARDRYAAIVGSEPPTADPSTADPSRKEPVRTAGVLWF